MNSLMITFILLNVINVIISTIKSLATVRCGKLGAAIANAAGYGFYTIVVVYMVCELPLWEKVLVVGSCNLVGVYLVKWVEEKMRKDKLWKVEVTIPTRFTTAVDLDLRTVPHSYIQLSNKHTVFNFYCATQAESQKVKDIVNQYDAKYFVSESKIL